MNYFLVIQTAFIGDVILATGVVEKLHAQFPDAKIDLLVRKGNESLLKVHPYLNEVIIWDKSSSKLLNLYKLSNKVRSTSYTHIINLHRFASSGFIVWRSKAKLKIGFDKNPFSFCYTMKYHHMIGNGKHEIERNNELIETITDKTPAKPKLYPSEKDFAAIKKYVETPYYCIAPASVWYTKQVPQQKWVELIKGLKDAHEIYLLGSKDDQTLCKTIIERSGKGVNLAGKLNLLESAALMKNASMNFVNDSAPLHLASAMNAPTSAFFCSTSPSFGFGPLADKARTIEVKPYPACKPCGLHGYKKCPNNNFVCGDELNMLEAIN